MSSEFDNGNKNNLEVASKADCCTEFFSGMIGTEAYVGTNSGVRSYLIEGMSQLQSDWRTGEDLGEVVWAGDHVNFSSVFFECHAVGSEHRFT